MPKPPKKLYNSDSDDDQEFLTSDKLIPAAEENSSKKEELSEVVAAPDAGSSSGSSPYQMGKVLSNQNEHLLLILLNALIISLAKLISIANNKTDSAGTIEQLLKNSYIEHYIEELRFIIKKISKIYSKQPTLTVLDTIKFNIIFLNSIIQPAFIADKKFLQQIAELTFNELISNEESNHTIYSVLKIIIKENLNNISLLIAEQIKPNIIRADAELKTTPHLLNKDIITTQLIEILGNKEKPFKFKDAVLVEEINKLILTDAATAIPVQRADNTIFYHISFLNKKDKLDGNEAKIKLNAHLLGLANEAIIERIADICLITSESILKKLPQSYQDLNSIIAAEMIRYGIFQIKNTEAELFIEQLKSHLMLLQQVAKYTTTHAASLNSYEHGFSENSTLLPTSADTSLLNIASDDMMSANNVSSPEVIVLPQPHIDDIRYSLTAPLSPQFTPGARQKVLKDTILAFNESQTKTNSTCMLTFGIGTVVSSKDISYRLIETYGQHDANIILKILSNYRNPFPLIKAAIIDALANLSKKIGLTFEEFRLVNLPMPQLKDHSIPIVQVGLYKRASITTYSDDGSSLTTSLPISVNQSALTIAVAYKISDGVSDVNIEIEVGVQKEDLRSEIANALQHIDMHTLTKQIKILRKQRFDAQTLYYHSTIKGSPTYSTTPPLDRPPKVSLLNNGFNNTGLYADNDYLSLEPDPLNGSPILSALSATALPADIHHTSNLSRVTLHSTSPMKKALSSLIQTDSSTSEQESSIEEDTEFFSSKNPGEEHDDHDFWLHVPDSSKKTAQATNILLQDSVSYGLNDKNTLELLTEVKSLLNSAIKRFSPPNTLLSFFKNNDSPANETLFSLKDINTILENTGCARFPKNITLEMAQEGITKALKEIISAIDVLEKDAKRIIAELNNAKSSDDFMEQYLASIRLQARLLRLATEFLYKSHQKKKYYRTFAHAYFLILLKAPLQEYCNISFPNIYTNNLPSVREILKILDMYFEHIMQILGTDALGDNKVITLEHFDIIAENIFDNIKITSEDEADYWEQLTQIYQKVAPGTIYIYHPTKQQIIPLYNDNSENPASLPDTFPSKYTHILPYITCGSAEAFALCLINLLANMLEEENLIQLRGPIIKFLIFPANKEKFNEIITTITYNRIFVKGKEIKTIQEPFPPVTFQIKFSVAASGYIQPQMEFGADCRYIQNPEEAQNFLNAINAINMQQLYQKYTELKETDIAPENSNVSIKRPTFDWRERYKQRQQDPEFQLATCQQQASSNLEYAIDYFMEVYDWSRWLPDLQLDVWGCINTPSTIFGEPILVQKLLKFTLTSGEKGQLLFTGHYLWQSPEEADGFPTVVLNNINLECSHQAVLDKLQEVMQKNSDTDEYYIAQYRYVTDIQLAGNTQSAYKTPSKRQSLQAEPKTLTPRSPFHSPYVANYGSQPATPRTLFGYQETQYSPMPSPSQPILLSPSSFVLSENPLTPVISCTTYPIFASQRSQSSRGASPLPVSPVSPVALAPHSRQFRPTPSSSGSSSNFKSKRLSFGGEDD